MDADLVGRGLRLHSAFVGLGVTAAAFPAILPAATVTLGETVLAAPGMLFTGLLSGVLLSTALTRHLRLSTVVAVGSAVQATGLVAAALAPDALVLVGAAAVSGVGFGLTEASGSAAARGVARRGTAHSVVGLTTSVALAATATPLLILLSAGVLPAGAALGACAAANAAACVAMATSGSAFDGGPERAPAHGALGAPWLAAAIGLALYVGVESLLAGWSSSIPFALLHIDPVWAALGTSAFWACMAAGRGGALAAGRRGVSPRSLLVTAGAGAAVLLTTAAWTAGSQPVLSVACVAATVVLLGPTYGLLLGLAIDRAPAAHAVSVTGPLVACGAAGGALVPLGVVIAGPAPGDASTFLIAAAVCGGWLAAVRPLIRTARHSPAHP